MDRIPINKYPYTDYHEINLDWVIERIQEMYTIIDSKIAAAVDPINQQITVINANISALQDNYNTLSERVDINSNRITNIISQIQGIGQTIAGILSNINTINGNIEDIEVDINFLRTQVGTHTEEIADIYDKLAAIDPDTGLMVDASNFDTEDRTVSILDDVLKFELNGGNKTDIYYLQPDLIPNTQNSYYPRVTMTFNPTTNKIELPSELTTGDHPLIIRGTYATNVDTDAELYIGDPLEYHIDGKKFIIDGGDENAVILMCLWSMHHSPDNIENVYNDNDVNVLHGIPVNKTVNGYQFGNLYQHSSSVSHYGINEYIYCFDKAGNLLSYGLIGDESGVSYVSIPVNTYSIWVGINVPSYTSKDINTLSFSQLSYGAGAYTLEDTGYVTMHVVDFISTNTTTRYTATYNDIKGLSSVEKLNMLTGKVYTGSSSLYSCNVNGSLNNLDPNLTYTPTLTFKDTGYTSANLKYNKVSLLINGLDANNVSY